MTSKESDMPRHGASSYSRNLLIAPIAAIVVFALSRELTKLWIGSDSLFGWAIALVAGIGSAALILYLETGSLFPSGARQKTCLDPTEYIVGVMRSLELIADPVQLQNAIAAQICEMLDAPAAALFLRDPDEERFTLGKQIGYQNVEIDQLVFERRGRLVGWLKTNQTALWVHGDREVVEYLEDYERQILEKLGVDLCLPFSAMNRLVGFAFIQTRSEASLMVREELLRRFCFQIGLALQNALLYDQQRFRLRRFYRAERLATTGQLAAGAAHEIRNPLAAISSSIQYLRWAVRRGRQDQPDYRGVVVLCPAG
jgi:signal transduction histidine kinase